MAALRNQKLESVGLLASGGEAIGVYVRAKNRGTPSDVEAPDLAAQDGIGGMAAIGKLRASLPDKTSAASDA